MTALLMFGLLALLVGGIFTAQWATAGGESSSAQHAADAAALGGAKGVVEELPLDLATGFIDPRDIAGLLGGVCAQTGRAEASRLAGANGAALTSYCWNPARDEVSVQVRMNTTSVSGPPAEARAEAETTFEAGSCELAAGFNSPTPRPDPEDDDDDPAPPPSPVRTTVDCGFGPLPVIFNAVSLRFNFIGLAAELTDLKPRLTK